MFVGILEIRLRLFGVNSLKEKRSIIKPLTHRLRQTFNISVAESGAQDRLQAAEITVACVSADSALAHSMLEQVLNFVEQNSAVEIMNSDLQIL